MKSVIILLIIFFSAGCHEPSLNLKPLSQFVLKGGVGFTQQNSYKFQYYYAENYMVGDSIKRRNIEEFVRKNLDQDYKQYDNYQIYVYRKTGELNDNFVSKESDDIAWHQSDILFIFYWVNGKYLSYTEFKNGNPIHGDPIEESN